MNESRVTRSVNETVSYAETFSAHLKRGDVVAIYGELGIGKTHFVKGVCKAFHGRTPVTSPSFVLLNRYQGIGADGRELLVYHMDLYRVKSVSEIYELGYEEMLGGDGISLIEWAESLGSLLPKRRYDVRLVPGCSEAERKISILNVGE